MLPLIPGVVIDQKAPRGSAQVNTRLGPNEAALLDRMAYEIGVSRSHLVRRLIVEQLLELEQQLA